MRRSVRIVALVILIISLLAGAGCQKAKNKTAATTAPTTAKKVTTTAATTKATTEEAKANETFGLSNYAHLPAAQQGVYDRLYDALDCMDSSASETVAEFELQVVDRVFFYSLLADHPLFFDARGGSNLYEDTGNGQRFARFDIKYIYHDGEYQARKETMRAAFEEIRQSLPKGANEVQIAKAVYDYLIKNCNYDHDYSGNSLQEAGTTASYADGALVDHKAVCSGYSRAFKLMMDWFELPCMCVSNSDHEWNIVFLEGNYYHIDVTWADTDANPGTRYFCVTDAEIYKDHDKPKIEVPECCVTLKEDLL